MPILSIQSVYPGTNGSSVGHAWLTITNMNGSIESYGFYPKISNIPNGLDGPGRIDPDDRQRFPVPDRQSQDFYITDAQAQAIRDFADRTKQASYSFDGQGINDPNGT